MTVDVTDERVHLGSGDLHGPILEIVEREGTGPRLAGEPRAFVDRPSRYRVDELAVWPGELLPSGQPLVVVWAWQLDAEGDPTGDRRSVLTNFNLQRASIL